MQHHLFFSLIEREGPYNVQKKAVHVGAYASKAEAMTRFEGMLKKFPATWEPSIIPASLNPIDTFLQNQKTISFTGSTDPELREKYPKIDWAFDHPEGKT
ncbi:MAG: hypothetical protein LRZ85_04450, partial [Alphaproteobacteria bacterium]|nr:hypothetical protein [Alphaproteobacteria bacterium]